MTVMGFSVVETYHTPLSKLLNARFPSRESLLARGVRWRKEKMGREKHETSLLLYISVEFILKLIYAQKNFSIESQHKDNLDNDSLIQLSSFFSSIAEQKEKAMILRMFRQLGRE
jgi:hypothetical protein